MPITQTRIYTGDQVYNNVFVGPMDHPATVRVTPSALGVSVIDAHGYIPQGFPFAKDGSAVGAGAGAATAGGGNTGTGTVGAITVDNGTAPQTYTLTATDATHFNVVGSVDGALPAATVGVAYNGPGINFTVTAGGVAFVAGDTFTIPVTTNDRVFGCTIEPVKVAASNAAGVVAAATVPVDVTVGTIGQVNRDILEDNLGRALTAAEVAGFAGSLVVLLD